MSAPSRTRILVSSLVAGALWLLVAGIGLAIGQIPSGASQLGAAIPDLMPPAARLWPAPWPVVALVLGALAVVVCHALFTALTAREATASVVGAWFAAVAAGAVVGLAFDIALAWESVAIVGPRGLLSGEFSATAAAGALWGLVTGWMPGLVVVRSAQRDTPERPRFGWLVAAAALGVVAIVATGLAGERAQSDAIAAEVEARRQVEAANTFGALPDPNAKGEPVPTAAAASGTFEPGWCTPAVATPLKGEPDAATGHRGLPIELMNFSEEPCVIEGYPDVAFGDQNDHLLDVTIEQGGSFMTQDPGPQRIEIPAGGTAVMYLGWDAASPHGALVTKTVYVAPTAGMPRGSWPIELDIVEGSTVKVTAWQLGSAPVMQ